MATVGLMLWPGPHDELMITDFKAGTSAAISALLPGDGQPSAPVLLGHGQPRALDLAIARPSAHIH